MAWLHFLLLLRKVNVLFWFAMGASQEHEGEKRDGVRGVNKITISVDLVKDRKKPSQILLLPSH